MGRTPLVIVGIDTADSPPISQKPYNLPLKHADCVQRELATLEKAGVITRSVSPWTSPNVIIPKKPEPVEPRKKSEEDFVLITELLTNYCPQYKM